jgi:hypothetical protein
MQVLKDCGELNASNCNHINTKTEAKLQETTKHEPKTLFHNHFVLYVRGRGLNERQPKHVTCNDNNEK